MHENTENTTDAQTAQDTFTVPKREFAALLNFAPKLKNLENWRPIPNFLWVVHSPASAAYAVIATNGHVLCNAHYSSDHDTVIEAAENALDGYELAGALYVGDAHALKTQKSDVTFDLRALTARSGAAQVPLVTDDCKVDHLAQSTQPGALHNLRGSGYQTLRTLLAVTKPPLPNDDWNNQIGADPAYLGLLAKFASPAKPLPWQFDFAGELQPIHAYRANLHAVIMPCRI